jgi:hypothetical protein
MSPAVAPPDIDGFIARWTAREGGAERANYALFLSELCDQIGVARPEPSGADADRNDYVFERQVRFRHDGGADSVGRIDLYKKNCFVLEAKQSRLKGAKAVAGEGDLFMAEQPDATRGRRGADRAWDVLMLNAKRQAEDYAKALPVSHGWPPFILVCDVGHCIEVYADFSGQGKNYTQFPDRQGFRIYLEDLRKADIRDRLAAIWREPKSLDPTRAAARVTREIAERLAAVSRAMEAKKYDADEVAHFLMRCLFTMFAEDMRLLPENSFRELLADCRTKPESFVPLLSDLWRAMNDGEFASSIRHKVLKFNGNLFKNAKVLPLGREEIGELAAAAGKSWRDVEPAIFGTLLEQALDPAERRRLGAHYTPRAYVERLVVATIIEPLRGDWRNVQATAETLRASGDLKGAAAAVKTFHDTLCATRVLDPACGTGNFLYVAMELMKKLEGEVLEALLDLGGQEALTGLGGMSVDPHQFLGLELNPRAAAIAELVLWIGYLQAHFRTKGGVPEPPILKAFKNIEVKNAVLTWDGYPVPKVVDGKETYPNPRRPTWPTAEFIVGNPPFIGGKDLRARLGSELAEALWAAHKHMNESADFVMYWWDRAADILAAKGTALRCFGFVTTNSITQEFSRRVMKKRMEAKRPVSLVMAIPDHPWTKATPDAAAVRIAMTVAEFGKREGTLREVSHESGLDTDQPAIEFKSAYAEINADLSVGTDPGSSVELKASFGLASRGMSLHGDGFIVTHDGAAHLGLGRRPGLEKHIREYRNGRDLMARPRNVMVIDLFGLDIDDVRRRFPEVYQHVKAEVKEKVVITKDGDKEYVGRDWNNRQTYKENWWVFGEPRRELRPALVGLNRYIATVETMRHRVFQFLDASILPDNKLVVVPTDDAADLGVLSSRIHVVWAIRAGGWLGMGNDPVYVKSKVFDPFPFPDCDDTLKADIRAVAEELDAFRKERQREHPGLTLTQMYNVLERLKAIEAAQRRPLPNPPPQAGEGASGAGRTAVPPLTADEERIKDAGLILILKELHERLDALVFRAYGWPATLSGEEIVARLVALNHERAAEEKRGLVRWLRPDYQIPRFGKGVDKQAAQEEGAQVAATLALADKAQKPTFPSGAVEQTAAVFAALAGAGTAVDAATIASGFKQGKKVEKKVTAVLMSLARLGHVASNDGERFAIRRAA